MSCLWKFFSLFAFAWVLSGALYLWIRDKPNVLDEIGWTRLWDALGLYTLSALWFVVFGHFKHRDFILSALCLASLTWWCVVVMWTVRNTPCPS